MAPGDIDVADLKALIDEKEKDDVILGIHPDAGLPVMLKKGPYGHYLQLGDDEEGGKPKRVSLPKNIPPENIDLEMAVALLELPRRLGNHPETGTDILANVGRYGPYVQYRKTFASLTAGDDVLTIGLDRALELIGKKEARNKPLRTLGPHPETGEIVEIFEGRYGPYIKHQRTNASIPKNTAPEAISMEEAVSLLVKKAASKGRWGRRKK